MSFLSPMQSPKIPPPKRVDFFLEPKENTAALRSSSFKTTGLFGPDAVSEFKKSIEAEKNLIKDLKANTVFANAFKLQIQGLLEENNQVSFSACCLLRIRILAQASNRPLEKWTQVTNPPAQPSPSSGLQVSGLHEAPPRIKGLSDPGAWVPGRRVLCRNPYPQDHERLPFEDCEPAWEGACEAERPWADFRGVQWRNLKAQGETRGGGFKARGAQK